MNTSPNSDTIGRSCKVNKEELVGMMVALESFLKEDYQALYASWERSAESMKTALSRVPGVEAAIFVPQIANQCPHVRVAWAASRYPITASAMMTSLRAGEPSIELVPSPGTPETLEIATWMLRPGEPEIIARRIREILTKGA
jgi:seryl-tRNA(Sec) selenium transferase